MAASTTDQHLVSCLVENNPGVLARITIAVPDEGGVLDQVLKQLVKIVDVIHVEDLSETDHVERELMLIKVKSAGTARSEIMQICDIFRARIVDVHEECLVIEVSGTLSKNEALRRLFEPFGIVEMARTGRIALHRGSERLALPQQPR